MKKTINKREALIIVLDIILLSIILVNMSSFTTCVLYNYMRGDGAVCTIRLDKYGEHVVEIPLYLFFTGYAFFRILYEVDRTATRYGVIRDKTYVLVYSFIAGIVTYMLVSSVAYTLDTLGVF